jgi:thioredoxin reductase (NADPH)
MTEDYDLAIIGAGPAGLSAGVYALNSGIKTIIFDNIEQPSMMTLAHLVTNYLGLPDVTGYELYEKFKAHLTKMGGKIKSEAVEKIERSRDGWKIKTSDAEYFTKSIIIATGSKHRKAGIKGEDTFFGKGVSYCATCDGPLFKGKNVVVLGGGNSAISAANYLAGIGCKVTIIYRRRREDMKAQEVEVQKAERAGAKFVFEREVKEILGSTRVEGVLLNDGTKVQADAVFVYIGEVPLSVIAKDIGIETDENGYIKVNERKETNIKGVFAAGDVSTTPLRQIITAAADGAIAALSAAAYLRGVKNEKRNKK